MVIPALVLLLMVRVFVPVLIELIVVLAGIPVAATTSSVCNPVTESTTIVFAPLDTGDITVLTLVTSPTFMIGSFTDTFVELTVVVVPSTCKLPLMITSPSLLKPLGNGSMKIWFPPPALVSIRFDEIPILSISIPPVWNTLPVIVDTPTTTKLFVSNVPVSYTHLTLPTKSLV